MKGVMIYLVGFPGVGKYTISKEICKQADFRLYDNHTLNNVFFPFVREGSGQQLPQAVWAAIRSLRQQAFNFYNEHGNPDFNFVLTNALAEDDPVDVTIYEAVEQAFSKKPKAFIPVTVMCSEEENIKRVQGADRSARMKSGNVAEITEIHKKHRPLVSKHQNALQLDVSNLEANEAAEIILTHARKIYEETCA